jgi:hypothetical protein
MIIKENAMNASRALKKEDQDSMIVNQQTDSGKGDQFGRPALEQVTENERPAEKKPLKAVPIDDLTEATKGDAIQLLEAQHREVEALFTEIEGLGSKAFSG